MSLLVFPLTFVSSAYVPVATMPGWMQAFARNQPITAMVDAVRSWVVVDPVGLLGHTAAALDDQGPAVVGRPRRGVRTDRRRPLPPGLITEVDGPSDDRSVDPPRRPAERAAFRTAIAGARRSTEHPGSSVPDGEIENP